MLKKSFVWLIVLAMLLMVTPLSAAALRPSRPEEEGFDAFEDENGHVIIYRYNGKDTEVTVPLTYDGKIVTGIYTAAFRHTGVTSVTIPEGITDIGNEAFKGCAGLVTVNLPTTVTKLSKEMFWGCSSLTEISLPSTLTEIGGSALRDCVSLTNVVLPKGLTAIRACAFQGCRSLTSVEIPDSVTVIGGSAFYGCVGLTEITIPKGVQELGIYTFAECPDFTAIHVAEDNPYLKDVDGVLYSKNGSTLLRVPCGRTGELVIPEGVKSIADYAAFDCEGLTKVTIPESVSYLGMDAFHESTQLTGAFEVDEAGVMYNNTTLISADPAVLTGAYTVRPGTTRIAANAFANCTGLTAVTIPDSVTYIGSLAFQSCTALADITFPDGVRLGMGVFDDTAYSNDPANYDESGVLYLNGYLIWAREDTLAGSYTVKEGTKVIAAGSIFDCNNLTELVIPEGVTFIDYHACIHCLALEHVVLPQSITAIDATVFTDCDKLASIDYAATEEEWVAIGFNAGNVPVNCLTASPNPVIIGDADGDGNVTSTDARLALQLSVGKIGEGDIADPDAVDADHDGKITSTDARMILQYSVGKITEWP